jgi:energy-coupling factor transport system permease protein
MARRLVAGSLDRAVDVAATLELRGYARGAPGSARGGPPARYAGRFAAAGIAIAAITIAARIAGVGAYDSYPTAAIDVSAPTLGLAVAIPLLAALPFATSARGRGRRG